MSDPYIGEIRLFAGAFAPKNWKFCNGEILQIEEYYTLYTLIGTTYGGDGNTTFALPDMSSRVPLGVGSGEGLTPRKLGDEGGEALVQLTVAELPTHPHPALASDETASTPLPVGNLVAQVGGKTLPYVNASPTVPFSIDAVSRTGGNDDHENRIPYLCVQYIISLYGKYPSQH